MGRRRRKLEDSLQWHQFNFDADTELQWISDHRPAATSKDYGKNLVDAQNLNAKHKVGSFKLRLTSNKPELSALMQIQMLIHLWCPFFCFLNVFWRYTFKFEMLPSFNLQKFEKEVTGHEPVVGKVVGRGQTLEKAKHFAADDIGQKRGQLQAAWDDLLGHSKHRKDQLDKALDKQKVCPEHGLIFSFYTLRNDS